MDENFHISKEPSNYIVRWPLAMHKQFNNTE